MHRSAPPSLRRPTLRRSRSGPARCVRVGTGLAMAAAALVVVSPHPSGGATTTFTAAGGQLSRVDDPAGLVDPFVGTAPGDTDFGTGGGAGNTFPGADVPFGMVQWSPDTVRSQPGGYLHLDNRIRGFGLTHFSGAGCDAFGDLPFLPWSGAVTTSPASDPGRYVATFSHDREAAEPGYYRVRLDSGPQVELTATPRTGMGRLTFPAGAPAAVLMNVSGSVNGTDAASISIGRDTVSGWANSGDFCGSGNHYRVHFVAEFSQPFASVGTWHDATVQPGSTTATGGAPRRTAESIQSTGSAGSARRAAERTTARQYRKRDTMTPGPGSGGWVTFPDGSEVTVRVGLSFVDVEGARRNLRAESGTRSFDAIRQAAHDEWNKRLGTIGIRGGTGAELATFYTALYHVLLHPNVFSDVDGRYTGFDGAVHTVESGHAQYANFSGWDVYRSQVQLLALLAPTEASDVARSMLNQALQGGAWDRWSQANDFTGVMVGDPYQSIVASLYAFGARDFDARRALASMVDGATEPTSGYTERPGLRAYLDHGYVPNGEPDVWGAAATTLEYATADFGVAELAGALGDTATRSRFMRRAQYWEHLFNPATGYLQPRRRDGSFAPGFDPASMTGYVEGNGAQYTWMVPHNPAGLFTAMGGNAAVVRRLDRFFTELNAGPRKPYAFLGNEPSLQTPWMYAYAGAPYRTQAVVRQAVNTLYTPTPGGYVGNDDLGEMSSWYVWAALGMYPQVPGRAELVLASPLFPQATIRRPTGQTITLNAPRAGRDVPYVTALHVNGRESTRPWLPANFVDTGGTLDFALSSTPDPAWGAAPGDAPPSFRAGELPFRSYAQPEPVVVPPGEGATVTVGVQDVSGRARPVRWSAEPPKGTRGLSLGSAQGRFTVPAGGRGSAALRISAAAGTPQGVYQVPVTFTADPVRQRTTVTVVVAERESPLASYNTVSTSDDADNHDADYDGHGYSYSRQALAAAGVRPGGPVRVGGFTFTWPDVPARQADSVAAHGQTIAVRDAPAGATALSLLGSATNGPSQGTLTVTYTDGTHDEVTVGFGDWVPAADKPATSFGNTVAVATPYRNSVDGDRQNRRTLVFATAPIPIPAGKRVRGVTLPSTVDKGILHVFAVAAGTPPPQ